MLSPDVAGAAVAKAETDRRELAAADTGTHGYQLDKVLKMLPRAAAAYRPQVAQPREALTDEWTVHRERAALREQFGSPVKLRPATDGKHLIAEVSHSPAALLAAAGGPHYGIVAGELFGTHRICLIS